MCAGVRDALEPSCGEGIKGIFIASEKQVAWALILRPIVWYN